MYSSDKDEPERPVWLMRRPRLESEVEKDDKAEPETPQRQKKGHTARQPVYRKLSRRGGQR